MSASATDPALRRRLRFGTVGTGVVAAALSVAVVVDLDVLTGTSRRAVEATAGAYGTTPQVAFVTLLVGSLFPGGDGGTGVVAAVVRLSAGAAALATAIALGVPLVAVSGSAFPVALLVAFVAGLPLGLLALCGATVGTALAVRMGWRGATLLGTVGPVAGVVLVHAVPTGPVWTVSAGATFVGAAAVGGGWSVLAGDRARDQS
jgi:hypothetical protein